MSRNLVYCRDIVQGPRPVFPIGWYVEQSTGAEVVLEGRYEITGAIEYPEGNFTPLTWGGERIGVFFGGDIALADESDVALTGGAVFAVRWFQRSPNGFVFSKDYPLMDGEGLEANPGTTDRTMGGNISPPGSNVTLAPLLVLGPSQRRSFLIIGDSIAYGGGSTHNDKPDMTGDIGGIARAIGAAHAYANFAVSSTKASDFDRRSAMRRLSMQGYFSDVVCGLGRNDVGQSNPRQVLQALDRVRALFPDKPFYQTTLTPTSTGSWTRPDGLDQTAAPTSENTASLNDSIRSGRGLKRTGVIDVRAAIQMPSDNKLWAPGCTSDGIHPNPLGHTLIRNSPSIEQMLA